MTFQEISQYLERESNPKQAKFAGGLTPGSKPMLGVKVPTLRKLAKEIAKGDYEVFICEYEEDCWEAESLKAMVLGYCKVGSEEDCKRLLELAATFVPRIHDWSVCDSFCQTFKVARRYPELVYTWLENYARSDSEFLQRVAAVLCLSQFLTDEWIDRVFVLLDQIRATTYYSKMGVAWCVATALAKFPSKTWEYLSATKMDEWTYLKTLQKAKESYRVSDEDKQWILEAKEVWIRRARMEEEEQIHAVYERARQFMKETGNPNQWGEQHPLVEDLRRDILDGKLYVCISKGSICGAFYFVVEDDPTYARIDGGAWESNKPYGVIHKVASMGTTKGLFTYIFNFAYRRCPHLRIDTHEDNVVMQSVVEKHGFSKRGIIYVRDNSPRLAYEYHCIPTTLCYIEKDDSYLLLYRNKKKEDANEGKWIGIGGKIEPLETPTACMLREVKEETGLTVLQWKKEGIVQFRSDVATDETMHLYTTSDFKGDLVEDCEEGTLRFIPKNEVEGLSLWEGDRVFLKDLLDGKTVGNLTLQYEGDKLVDWYREEKNDK